MGSVLPKQLASSAMLYVVQVPWASCQGLLHVVAPSKEACAIRLGSYLVRQFWRQRWSPAQNFSNRRLIKVYVICVWPDWVSAGTAHVVGEVGLLVLVICVDLGY